MADDCERPKPKFRRVTTEKVAEMNAAVETLPSTPRSAITAVPDDTPEWLFVAARCLTAKHMNASDLPAARVRHEEWVRLLSSFRLGLLAAGLPDWMAQSAIMGVLDSTIGKAVETLIRAVPHIAHAAVKGRELNDAAAWKTQVQARALQAANVVAEGVRLHRPVDAVLEQADVVLNPPKEEEPWQD